MKAYCSMKLFRTQLNEYSENRGELLTEKINKNSVLTMVKHFPGGGPQEDGFDPHLYSGQNQVYPGNNFEYHLKPFKKGESGNPGGRSSKYIKLKKALDRWGNEEIPYDFWDMPPDEATTMKEQVLYKIWDRARHGNLRCMEILAQLGCLDDK